MIQAYHDIGDGGLLATVAEMMFAGTFRCCIRRPNSSKFIC
ncbi:AIR synthase-related protein [Acinetobacter pittii]